MCRFPKITISTIITRDRISTNKTVIKAYNLFNRSNNTIITIIDSISIYTFSTIISSSIFTLSTIKTTSHTLVCVKELFIFTRSNFPFTFVSCCHPSISITTCQTRGIRITVFTITHTSSTITFKLEETIITRISSTEETISSRETSNTNRTCVDINTFSTVSLTNNSFTWSSLSQWDITSSTSLIIAWCSTISFTRITISHAYNRSNRINRTNRSIRISPYTRVSRRILIIT